eukprot:3759470-Rhodomonas_salina.3
MMKFTLGDWMKSQSEKPEGMEGEKEREAGASPNRKEREGAAGGGDLVDLTEEGLEDGELKEPKVVWDAAAMLDGVEFDLEEHWKTQRAKGKEKGVVGVSR